MQSSPFHFVTDINSSDTKKQDETHQGILTSAKLFDFFIIIIISVTRVFKFLIKYSMKISSRQYHVPQLNNLNLKIVHHCAACIIWNFVGVYFEFTIINLRHFLIYYYNHVTDLLLKGGSIRENVIAFVTFYNNFCRSNKIH